jgi:SPP1 gp7 family putative phage head morphogenesis protein
MATARSKAEREEQAERNRQLLLGSEVLLLGILLGRRSEIGKPQTFESSVAAAVMHGRRNARSAGVASVLSDLLAVGATPGGIPVLARIAAQDAARAVTVARSIGERASKLLRGGASAIEARAAIKPALERVAATESAEAFSDGRRTGAAAASSVTRIFKVWDAVLDKRTCPRCAGMDGVIVGLGEAFDLDQPAHPFCRCTFTLLRADEFGDVVSIREIRS